MVERGKTIWAVIVLMAVGANAFADLMPASGLDPGDWQGSAVVDVVPSVASGASFPLPPIGWGDPVCFAGGSWRFLPEAGADAAPTVAAPSMPVLMGGPGSLGLCVYALMGLGLCRSAPWVKRLSFGLIPDWYHAGGPSQIGHSLAVAPNCLCPAPVYCFVQPGSTQADSLSRWRLTRMVASLVRCDSRLLPRELLSRGPP